MRRVIGRILFLWLVLTCASASSVETYTTANAAQCIRKGSEARSQTLTNTCDRRVVLIWCHDRDEKGYRNGLCGKGRQFFQMNATLEPGETKSNMFSMPLQSNVSFGACFGGYGDFRRLEEEGRYLCKAGSPDEPGGLRETVSTAKAATREQACDMAQAMARGATVDGACVCEERGSKPVAICRVTSYRVRQEESLQEKARKEVQDHLTHCDPGKDVLCPEKAPERKNRNGGPGIRG